MEQLSILIIIGMFGFFGFLYVAGRAFGAGIRKGGDLWRSGQHEADKRYRRDNEEI